MWNNKCDYCIHFDDKSGYCEVHDGHITKQMAHTCFDFKEKKEEKDKK